MQSVFAQVKTQTEQKKVIVCSDCGFPINGKPIFLPKPEYPKAALMVRASGAVQIQITIDENGNVESAKAVSGHPLLLAESVKTALKSKWKPVTLSGVPIKISGIIVFNFLPDEPIQPKEPKEEPQEINKSIKIGIVNGKATYLPKPEYLKEAKDFCASGIVKVEVLISEDGNVISAKAISGDKLLRDSAVEAAKKAKFSQTPDITPVKVKGIVVYNFPAEKRCIEKGVINNRAIYLPKPVFPKSCRCNGTIKVRILVDVATGKVVVANAFSGNPLLRASAVAAARQTKFAVGIIDGDGKPVYVKAFLVYKFNPNGTIEL